MLKTTHLPPDNLDEYKKEFGSIGIQLHAAVCKSRVMLPTQSSSNLSITQTSKILINKTLIILYSLYSL